MILSSSAVGVAKWEVLVTATHAHRPNRSFGDTVLSINPDIYTDRCDLAIISYSVNLLGRYTNMQPKLLIS